MVRTLEVGEILFGVDSSSIDWVPYLDFVPNWRAKKSDGDVIISSGVYNGCYEFGAAGEDGGGCTGVAVAFENDVLYVGEWWEIEREKGGCGVDKAG
jgi:hypothetical protein